MAVLEFRDDPGANILVPAMPSAFYRTTPWLFAANLTIARGQAVARQTANGKGYPLNLAATDGTQVCGGFASVAFGTDPSGVAYYVTGSTSAMATPYTPPVQYVPVVEGGIFDPFNLFTAPPSGTVGAETDTIVLGGTIAVGDTYSVSAANGAQANYVGGSTVAGTVASGLQSMISGDPAFASILTASVSGATISIAGASNGYSLGLKVGATTTSGTITLTQTAAAVSAQTAEVDTFTAGGTWATADTISITINYPNLSTHAVTYTATSSHTTAQVATGLFNAWNADPVAAAYGTATNGTSSVCTITSAIPGSAMNLTAGKSSTSGTNTKAVTAVAFGRNINDILAGFPGAHVDQSTGYWVIM